MMISENTLLSINENIPRLISGLFFIMFTSK
jgi:hypothetical protein